MTSRKDIYRKYYQSDIFSLSSSSLLSPKIRVRQPQRSLAKTKDDLFNTEIHSKIYDVSKSGIKRQKDFYEGKTLNKIVVFPEGTTSNNNYIVKLKPNKNRNVF